MRHQSDSVDRPTPFSVEDVPWDWEHGERFGTRARRIGKYGGGSHVGVLMEELSPGKQSCPAHYHMLEEEHLLVLDGQMTLHLGNANTGKMFTENDVFGFTFYSPKK